MLPPTTNFVTLWNAHSFLYTSFVLITLHYSSRFIEIFLKAAAAKSALKLSVYFNLLKASSFAFIRNVFKRKRKTKKG